MKDVFKDYLPKFWLSTFSPKILPISYISDTISIKILTQCVGAWQSKLYVNDKKDQEVSALCRYKINDYLLLIPSHH